MNPVAKEILMHCSDGDVLIHYGIKRRSGRYPWGSGKNPYQHSGDFLSRVNELKKAGKTEKQIAEEFDISTTHLRTQVRLANYERRSALVEQAKSLREKGYSLNQIAAKMGYKNDSSVRALLDEKAEQRMNVAMNTAEFIKEQIDTKGMIDVGTGVERSLNVSREQLNEALYILDFYYGYPTYGAGVPQVTKEGQQTNIKVVCPPGTEHNAVYEYLSSGDANIHTIDDYTSDDGGETFRKSFTYPESMDSSRLAIRYAEDGGVDKDGVIEIRRGVDDLSLGNSHYAQVRILVDGDHYLKGMAVYSDDLPDGVDVMFNTNKAKGTAVTDVLKPVKRTADGEIDQDNPFGSLIKENGGQSYRIQMGEDGDGNYSYYLWDAAGNLIFDALGAYALHDSIIKDVNVADDANINQSKIDMASVAERLNTDGSITVSAANVTIDNTTLDYKLTSMTTATAEAQAAADAAAAAAEALESEAVIKITQYYAVNNSASTPPSSGVAAAIVGTSVVEGCQVGTSATATSSWTTVYPTVSEGEYLWTAFFVAYVDGSYGWTTPTCLSDGVARESISTLVTELAVVQGQITAKVWQTDIDTAVDTINGTITTLQDRYATITQTVNGIETEIGDLTTTVTGNYETLDGKITTISETADGITATVSSLQNMVNSNYSDLSSKITAVETTASGISATVSDLETTVSGNYTDLSDKIAALTVTTDGITATVSDLETTVADNYTVLSDKISSLAVTADDITASVSSVQSQVTDLSATLDSSVQTSTAFFVIGDSDEAPPYEPGEAFAPSYVGTAAVGAAIVDGSDSGGWTTDRLTAGEGEYLWMCYRLEYHDGTTVWTTPVCLTDDYTRTSVASLVLTTNSITATVSDLTTTVTENYETLSSKITTVETTASGISARVTQTESDISANAASITTISGELSLKVDKDDNDQIVSMLNASADVITLTANRLVIDSDNFSLTEKGQVTAKLGTIGGWSLTDTRLRSSSTISIGKEESGMLLINEDDKPYIHVQDDTGHTTFQVTRTGTVYIDNGLRMYCPTEDNWVKTLYFTGEDDAVLMTDYDIQAQGFYTTGAVNCNALFCDVGATFTGEVGIYGSLSINGYTPKVIVSIQSISVTTSSTVANGSTGSATGTFTAVSGASYLLLPQRFNYGYCTAISYSGTTVTATLYNGSGSTHTLAGSVAVIAYV